MYKYTNISPKFGLQTHKTWIKNIQSLFRETFHKNSLLFRWVFPQKNQGNCDGDKNGAKLQYFNNGIFRRNFVSFCYKLQSQTCY